MRFIVALPIFVGLLIKVFAMPSPDPNVQVVLNIAVTITTCTMDTIQTDNILGRQGRKW